MKRRQTLPLLFKQGISVVVFTLLLGVISVMFNLVNEKPIIPAGVLGIGLFYFFRQQRKISQRERDNRRDEYQEWLSGTSQSAQVFRVVRGICCFIIIIYVVTQAYALKKSVGKYVSMSSREIFMQSTSRQP